VQNQRFPHREHATPRSVCAKAAHLALFDSAQLSGVFYGAGVTKPSLSSLLSPTTLLLAAVWNAVSRDSN
jgi:hypothetical protein